MAHIFVSYRRDDSDWATGTLINRLRERFGKQAVFQDIDGIEPGKNWRSVIEESISGCSVMVVVIGEKWAQAKDENGNIRLNNPDDTLRFEVERGLSMDNVAVIPTVLRPAKMPNIAEVPTSISSLCDLQGVAIYRGGDFDIGFRKLAEAIDANLRHSGIELGGSECNPSTSNPPRRSYTFPYLIGALLGAVLLIVFAVFIFTQLLKSPENTGGRGVTNLTADQEDLERVARRYIERPVEPDRSSKMEERAVPALGQPDYSNLEFRFDERIFSFSNFHPEKVSEANPYQSAITMDRTLILIKTSPIDQVRFQARTTGKDLIFSPGAGSPPSHVETINNLTDTGIYQAKTKHLCFDISEFDLDEQISISFRTSYWDAKEGERSWFGAIAYPGCLDMRVLAIGREPNFFKGLQQKKCSNFKSAEEPCSDGVLVVSDDKSRLLWRMKKPEANRIYMFYFDIEGGAVGHE